VLILRLKSEKNEAVEEFIEPKVSRAIEGGLHIWQTSGWLPAQLQHRLHELKYEAASVCVTVTSHVNGFPDCHGTRVRPHHLYACCGLRYFVKKDAVLC